MTTPLAQSSIRMLRESLPQVFKPADDDSFADLLRAMDMDRAKTAATAAPDCANRR